MSGLSSQKLAEAYTAATGRPWIVTLGFKQALFEVAIDVLRRSAERSPQAIRQALFTTKLTTTVGPVDFRTGPVPGISKTPLVVGQWKKRGKAMDLLIVDNTLAPQIPKQAALEPIRYGA
jgi:branched-chain amino acid transport system substrate-binding protein